MAAFIIKGTEPKRVILRGLGPSLNLSMQNPSLSLWAASGILIASNDNWRSTQEAEIISTGLAPTYDVEAAIVVTLNPGSYIAKLSAGGRGLCDLYDLSPQGSSYLSAVGMRGNIQTGDDVLATAIAIPQTEQVLIRVLGRSLVQYLVRREDGPWLADTYLELRDSSGSLIAFNDDWATDQDAA